ncbi:hypothetical protein EI613_12370 [Azospirillum sp. 412522]|nr:hypothetical protein [Azospirillum sp. 412522]MBY6262697.1 hypothetical protein [Azospirillum sp. 412522]
MLTKELAAALIGAALGCATTAAVAGDIAISAQIPYDVTIPPNADSATVQKAYNVFSWNLFIAANWVASPTMRGEADTSKPFSGSGARVWETYKDTSEVFTTPPTRPTSWNQWSEAVPAYCPADAKADQGQRTAVLSEIGKQDPVIDGTVQPMSGKLGYLVDQNGERVWIDVRMNKPAFDFIYDNKYYDANVQNAAQKTLLFPNSGDNATRTVGPINVKPAWKVMGKGDDPSTFYTRDAYLVDAPAQKCRKVQVGLVAFHYTVKTTSAKQWIWGTFEHKSNAPSCAPWDYDNPKATCRIDWKQSRYSFADPNCPDCAMNALPTPATAQKPVQVVRIIPIPPEVQALNQEAAALLKGTVWENYELLNTQFPADPSQLYGNPWPTALANAALETYNQGTTPWDQTSSCLGCHFLAPTTAQPYGNYFADFVFQFAHAKPFPPQ